MVHEEAQGGQEDVEVEEIKITIQYIYCFKEYTLRVKSAMHIYNTERRLPISHNPDGSRRWRRAAIGDKKQNRAKRMRPDGIHPVLGCNF